MEWFPALLTLVYGLAFLAVAARILTVRHPHAVALAWLLLALLVPVLGVVLYFMVGERRLGRRWIERAESGRAGFSQRYEAVALGHRVDPDVLAPVARAPARLAESLAGVPVMSGHDVRLIAGSEAFFDALIADVECCRHQCTLEFYIWHEGGRVLELVEALVRAAARGVRIRALMDGLGSRPFLRSASARRMRAAGIEVIAILPASWLRLVVARVDLRDHRKLAVLDERIAYAGSANLADPRHYKLEAGLGPWVDAMLRIEGPASAMLETISQAMAAVQLEQPMAGAASGLPARDGQDLPAGSVQLQPYPSGPGFATHHVESVILTAIYCAQREIAITTPYFAPGESVITALRAAARRGVAVTLILPLRCDSLLVHYASAAYFAELLAAGVRIERFEGGLLHTKSMVIDQSFAMFGTLNFDLRSFHLNFELSILIYSQPLAQGLLRLQAAYLRDCHRLDEIQWQDRPWWRRLAENSAQLALPLL